MLNYQWMFVHVVWIAEPIVTKFHLAVHLLGTECDVYLATLKIKVTGLESSPTWPSCIFWTVDLPQPPTQTHSKRVLKFFIHPCVYTCFYIFVCRQILPSRIVSYSFWWCCSWLVSACSVVSIYCLSLVSDFVVAKSFQSCCACHVSDCVCPTHRELLLPWVSCLPACTQVREFWLPWGRWVTSLGTDR